jgi:hypothetical protein
VVGAGWRKTRRRNRHRPPNITRVRTYYLADYTQAMTGGTHIKMVLPKASEGFDIGRATAAHGMTFITDPHTATPNH